MDIIINQKLNKYSSFSSYKPKINIINNRNGPIKNNLTLGNTINNNSDYKTNTSEVTNNFDYLKNIININNSNAINGRNLLKDNYSLHSQKITNPVIKSGVTTVIQHYSGRRKQYNQYEQNNHIINK